MATYIVNLDGQNYGPYDLSVVRSMKLPANIAIMRPGIDQEWIIASQLPELSGYLDVNLEIPSRSSHTVGNRRQSDLSLYKQKRKAALIGIFTLGLAGLSVLGVGEAWRLNIFSGTSMDRGGLGFVLKIISFCIVSVLVAIPVFIISVFQFIGYSIKIASC